MNEKKVEYAVKEFCKNPYWKEIYEKAPSPKSKRYKALMFYGSEFSDANDEMEERHKLEEEMDLRDWEYLYKYAGHNPWSAKCRKKIEEFKAKQNEE